MSGDTVEALLAAYLILGPVGAAAGMMIIARRWLRPRAHEGQIATSRRRGRLVGPLTAAGRSMLRDRRAATSGMEPKPVKRTVDGSPRPIHRQPDQLQSVGGHRPHGGAVVLVVVRLEQVLGVDAGTEAARQHPAMCPSERGAVAGADEHRLAEHRQVAGA